jgi:hypothetical protein
MYFKCLVSALSANFMYVKNCLCKYILLYVGVKYVESYLYLLLIPLSDISMRSYFAAKKPGCILLIFGFTPTLEPPEGERKHAI